MNNVAPIIEFMKIVEKLCLVERDIKLSNGTPDTDASHILKLCYWIMLVLPYLKHSVDYCRMLEMALVHDLVEAECGDIPLCAQEGKDNLKALKKANELAAIERYRNQLPGETGKRFYELFMDYETRSSAEAKVVYILDKLEANFQACRYQGGNVRYWGGVSGGMWYYQSAMKAETVEAKAVEAADEEILSDLEYAALQSCQQCIIKSNIEVDCEYNILTLPAAPIAIQLNGFMDEVDHLCQVERDNLMVDGSKETDAGHIIKLAYLVMLVTPHLKRPVNYCRMLELALVHDLVEARTGDYSLSAQHARPGLKEEKRQREQEAAGYFRSILPEELGAKIYGLYSEYEEQQTDEAKIVWILDKLEANLQANRYNGGDVRYWAACEGGEWYYDSAVTPKPQISELGEDILAALETAIIALSRENIRKCNIFVAE